MASPTTVTIRTSAAEVRRGASSKTNELIANTLCLAAGVTVVSIFAHLSGRPLAALLAFGATLLLATCIAQQLDREEGSPLEINGSLRCLRGIFAGFLVAAGSAALLSPLRGTGMKTFLIFAGLLAVSRVALRSNTAHELTASTISSDTILSAWDRSLKRAIDVVLASMALVLVAPIFVIVALAIKLDSQGPVFFSQDRVGYKGRRFRILKFRSMHVSAPHYHRSPLDHNDPRITRVGRAIRRLSLDELPQLWNVVRGEMSMVGPRPEMPFIVSTYTSQQHERLNAVPGITGLWQISPARALPIHENVAYDLYYIAHPSFFLDLAILCRTAGSVVRGVGAA
jgi:lipopolysaccharide/colanic/teichoic acid biosynthesis glycosyltransferase